MMNSQNVAAGGSLCSTELNCVLYVLLLCVFGCGGKELCGGKIQAQTRTYPAFCHVFKSDIHAVFIGNQIVHQL